MRYFLVGVFFLFGSSAFSQISSDTLFTEQAKPIVQEGENSAHRQGVLIGVTPSSVLNIFPGVQLNTTWMTNNRFGIDVEAGFLFGRYDDAPLRGYRLRGVGKYFIEVRDKTSGYLGLGYNYRRTYSYRSDWVDRDQGNFQELIDYRRIITLQGVVGMIGIVEDVGKNWSISFGLGLGLGERAVVNSGLPPGAVVDFNFDDFLSNDLEGSNPAVLVILNCKVQYHLAGLKRKGQ